MNRFKLIGAALIVAAMALVAVAAIGLHGGATTAEAQPLPPTKFYGTVTVNGSAAAVGGAIRAKVDGNVCGQTLIANIQGVGANAYQVDVVHSGQQQGCGDVGDTVSFEWASTPTGAEFIQCGTDTWDNTSFQLVNLTCAGGQQPTPTPTATPGTPTPGTPTPTGQTPSPTPVGQSPTATPAQPARAPVTGAGSADSSFAWWPLALAAAAVAGVGGMLALRRSAR